MPTRTTKSTRTKSAPRLAHDPMSSQPLANLYRVAAIDQFSRLEDDPALSHQDKLATLYVVLNNLVGVINRLSRTAPDRAPELFEYRADELENAYDFTRRVYRDYLERGLSMPDIFSLDRKLYQAIHDRRRYYKDHSLRLPRKRDVIDSLLARLGPDFSLSDIIESMPEIFRQQVTLYRTVSTRRRRSKPPSPK